MNLKPSTRIIAHIDMNSFFATVEQQANPQLRGRPLGVCAYLHERGCIIAASVEAKQRGMKVGMRVEEAREKVPEATFIQNEPAKYRSVIARVFAILRQVSDCVEYYSIDEAFVDLTGLCRDTAEAAWVLSKVQWRIQQEVGEWLKCSVGIASNRRLAKLASDLKKPNGLTVFSPATLDETFARLRVDALCGIGTRLRRRLNKAGVYTLLDVKRAPPLELIRLFGKSGYLLWATLSGLDVDASFVNGHTDPKSVGHSYCVPRHVNERGLIFPVFLRLLERAARRMRSIGKSAGGMSVTVGIRKKEDGEEIHGWGFPFRFTQSLGHIFHEPADDSFTLIHHGTELLHRLWSREEEVSFLAVTFWNLVTPGDQLRFDGSSLLTSIDTGVPWKRVSHAMDQIRNRYGEEAIQFASMVNLGDEAPDRIGFRKTVGVDVPDLG
jgi:DNA polymerase-4